MTVVFTDYSIADLFNFYWHTKSAMYLPVWRSGGLVHEFVFTKPFNVEMDYYDVYSRSYVDIVSVKDMQNSAAWIEHLTYSNFKEYDVTAYFYPYIQNGLKIWTMTQNWKDSETGCFFLEPYPKLFQLHFPYWDERPTREHLRQVLQQLSRCVDMNGQSVNEMLNFRSKYAENPRN